MALRNWEVTEVFATQDQGAPFNVFFWSPRSGFPTRRTIFNSERLKIKSLPDWNFGIKRYVKPIEELVPLFDTFNADAVRPA